MKPLEKDCDEPVIQNSVLRHFIDINQAPLLHPIWGHNHMKATCDLALVAFLLRASDLLRYLFLQLCMPLFSGLFWRLAQSYHT